MPFANAIKEEALVRSRRCCCICNEFVGLYTNVHHIKQEADGGSNCIDNAIVLCLRCHGEVGHYNARHPIGDKYTIKEVLRHRDEWWDWCSKNRSSPLPKLPIKADPHRIIIIKDGWVTRNVVTVRNTSNRMYYAVYLKILVLANPLNHNPIAIAKISCSPRNSGTIGEIELAGDVFGLFGVDSTGMSAVYVIIHTIDPNESVGVHISLREGMTVPEAATIEAVVSIESFELEPRAFVQKVDGSKTAQIICLPEAFTVEGMWLDIKKSPL